MKALLNLFHAVVLENTISEPRESPIWRDTVPYGFLFDPEIIAQYSDEYLRQLIPEIAHTLSLTAKQLNATFHKSWAKVRDAPLMQLVMEQLFHYITTYGYEALGVFSEDTIYLPPETLELPEGAPIKLLVIHGYTHEQIGDKVAAMLAGGIALKEETMTDLMEIIDQFQLTIEIDAIKNKEMRCRMCDRLHQIPSNPVEFLRYLIYKTTGKTLIIKNKETFETIRAANDTSTIEALRLYEQTYGLTPLASIFYRFKPLWLAFKHRSTAIAPMINRIRKLAVQYHQPLQEDALNLLTQRLKHGELDADGFYRDLDRVNIFRKIRLAYALHFRLGNCKAILYKIRNGKSYATAFDARAWNHETLQFILEGLMDNIATMIAPKIQGKKIYIPANVTYALPATEKQFIGNLPSGTSISLPAGMTIGVAWNNIKTHRIDLDFSLLGNTKYGWDANYRSASPTGKSTGEILFSGDMTDASQGATEAFSIQRRTDDSYLLMLNYFNFESDLPVPFKLFATQEASIDTSHYMVDPTTVEIMIPALMDVKEKMLGLVVTTPKTTTIYLGETAIGNTRSAHGKPYMQQARAFLLDTMTHSISLNELLLRAGAEPVTTKEEADLDLSPEALEKDTILNLLI